MRQKKDYDTILLERAKELEELLKIFSTYRILHCKEYQTDGVFDWDKFNQQKTIVWSWNRRTIDYKMNVANATNRRRYLRTFNKVLGIPHELIREVLGRFGSSKRIKIEDALKLIGGAKKWYILDYGQEAYTDKDTKKRIVKNSFARKIYPQQQGDWHKLLNNKMYLELTEEWVSKKVIKIYKTFEGVEKIIEQLVELDTGSKVEKSQLELKLKDKGLSKTWIDYIIEKVY